MALVWTQLRNTNTDFTLCFHLYNVYHPTFLLTGTYSNHEPMLFQEPLWDALFQPSVLFPAF